MTPAAAAQPPQISETPRFLQPVRFLRRAAFSRLLIFACLAALLLGTVNTAQSADVSRKNAADIRAVVQAQMNALAADDADSAFSFAAPNIRKMMGNAQNFLAMVRSGYAVVHRPASVMFLKAHRLEGQTNEGGEVVQAVQMTDTKGDAWLAIYRLQRQDDQTWRISGCVLVANEGKSV